MDESQSDRQARIANENVDRLLKLRNENVLLRMELAQSKQELAQAAQDGLDLVREVVRLQNILRERSLHLEIGMN